MAKTFLSLKTHLVSATIFPSVHQPSKILEVVYPLQNIIASQQKHMQEGLTLLHEQASIKDPKCGCYVATGDLQEKNDKPDILVPIVSSSYQLEIVNSIASVTFTQKYVNPIDKFLEIEYNFPINPNICVHKFTAKFADKTIEGVVKQKQEARQEYYQAKYEGKKAAYGSINHNREDVLTLMIGNVPPKEEVRIQIGFLQELSLSCNTFYELKIPSSTSPRYMKHLSTEKFDYGRADSQFAYKQGKFYWSFDITLKASRKITFFDSNTHDLNLVGQNDAKTEINLSMGEKSVPNTNFVLRYTIEDFHLPSQSFGSTDASSSAIISFIPKFCKLNIGDAYKVATAGKKSEVNTDAAQGQYIFYLDRSRSMMGRRMERAKEALIFLIKSLPENSYFNVIGFGTRSYDGQRLFSESVKKSTEKVQSAIEKITQMKANLGGSCFLQSYWYSFSWHRKKIEGYPRQTFILTDGYFENESKTIKKIKYISTYFPSKVHAIGIGSDCQKKFIKKIAKVGKGNYTLLKNYSNLPKKIKNLLARCLSPVLSKIKFEYDYKLVESIIPNPNNLNYVQKDQMMNFYVTFKEKLLEKTEFSLSYFDSVQNKVYSSNIQVDPSVGQIAFVDKMSHFKRIKALEDSYKNKGNMEQFIYYVKPIDKMNEILKESVKNQILSGLTAFVCVEKELVDGKFEETKDVGQFKIDIIPGHLRKNKVLERLRNRRCNWRICCIPRKTRPASGPQRSTTTSCKKLQSKCRMTEHHIHSASMLRAQYKSDFEKKRLNSNSFSTHFEAKDQISGWNSDQEFSMRRQFHDENILHSSFENSFKQEMEMPKIEEKEEKKNKLKRQSRNDEVNHHTTSDFLNKKQVKSSRRGPLFNILKIVSLQSAVGSWSDIRIIKELFGTKVEQYVLKSIGRETVITYLIAKWIERHYSQKEFCLVAKKGIHFVINNSRNYSKLVDKYSQYVK